MKVKENHVYCATFPESGGSVTAVMPDGSTKVIISTETCGQVNFLAISEEITVTDGVEIDPFVDAPAVTIGKSSGGNSGGETQVEQTFIPTSTLAISGAGVQDGLDKRFGDFAVDERGKLSSDYAILRRVTSIGNSIACGHLPDGREPSLRVDRTTGGIYFSINEANKNEIKLAYCDDKGNFWTRGDVVANGGITCSGSASFTGSFSTSQAPKVELVSNESEANVFILGIKGKTPATIRVNDSGSLFYSGHLGVWSIDVGGSLTVGSKEVATQDYVDDLIGRVVSANGLLLPPPPTEDLPTI